jgi:hypothetical protein
MPERVRPSSTSVKDLTVGTAVILGKESNADLLSRTDLTYALALQHANFESLVKVLPQIAQISDGTFAKLTKARARD